MGDGAMAGGGTESTQVLDLRDLIGAPLRAVVEADMVAAEAYHRFLVEVGFHVPEPGMEAEAPSPAWEHAVQALGLGAETRRLGQLRTVAFSYSATDPTTGRPRTMVVRVPLLALLPMPILQVATARLDFQVHLIGAVERLASGPSLAAPGSLSGTRLGARPGAERAPAASPDAPGGLLELIAAPAAAPPPAGPGALPGAAPAGGAGRPLRLFAELAGRSGGGGRAPRRRRPDRDGDSGANLKVRVRMRQAGLPAGLAAALNLMTSSIDGAGGPFASPQAPAPGPDLDPAADPPGTPTAAARSPSPSSSRQPGEPST